MKNREYYTVLNTAIPTVQYLAFDTETHSSYAPLHFMFPTNIRGGIFDHESITRKIIILNQYEGERTILYKGTIKSFI